MALTVPEFYEQKLRHFVLADIARAAVVGAALTIAPVGGGGIISPSQIAPQGSGSTLDADLLDGQHLSYFASAASLSAHAALGILDAHTSVTGAALDVIGLTAANTLGKLTPSAAPGAVEALLKSSASGGLDLVGAVVVGGGANTTQLTVKAHASQTVANPLMKFLDSAGSELARIHAPSDGNLYFGLLSGSATSTGDYNTGFGTNALRYVAAGSGNSALGLNALLALTDGSSNTAVGQSALSAISTANYNTALGFAALAQTTAEYQTGIGAFALYGTTTGQQNTAFGYAALFTNSTGSYNVAAGAGAGYLGASVTGGVLLGYQAGYSGNGSYNVFIGYQAGYSETGSNKLYIANTSTATPLIYGEFNTPLLRFNGNTEIGTGYAFRSPNYSSGLSGWSINATGDGEFNNIRIRGELAATVFTVNEINATAGTQFVVKSASTLTGDAWTAGLGASFYFQADNSRNAPTAPLFAVGDIVLLKYTDSGGIYQAYATITSRTAFTGYTEYQATLNSGSASTLFKAGMAIVDFGPAGTGGIAMSSDGAVGASANVSWFTHSGTPWSGLDLFMRAGNMNGSYGYATNLYGVGIGRYGVSSRSWLTVDDTNGIRLGNNTTVIAKWDTSGAITVGEVGASKSSILISAGALKLRNNLTDIITLATTGAATFGEVANSRSRIEFISGVASFITRNSGGVDATSIKLLSAPDATSGAIARISGLVDVDTTGKIVVKTGAVGSGELTLGNDAGGGYLTLTQNGGSPSTTINSSGLTANQVFLTGITQIRPADAPTSGMRQLYKETAANSLSGVDEIGFGSATSLNITARIGVWAQYRHPVNPDGYWAGMVATAPYTGSPKLEFRVGYGTWGASRTAPPVAMEVADGLTTLNGGILAHGKSIGFGTTNGYGRVFFDVGTGNAGIGSNLYYDGSNWVYPNTAGFGGAGLAMNILPGTGFVFYKATNGSNPATATEFAKVNESGDYYRQTVKLLGARATGWGAPTGTATRTAFATGTVTLPQLAERVKALIDDLTTHGLIGA